MLDEKVVAAMFGRYGSLHPLVLHRSLGRARTLGGLFDLLDGFPASMPVSWDAAGGEWRTTNLLQVRTD